MDRIKSHYVNVVCQDLIRQGTFNNVHELPKLEKIVLNLSLKDTNFDESRLLSGSLALFLISGQIPKPTFSSKASQKFKLQKNELSGCRLILRGRNAWSFLDYFFLVVCPRIKSFSGLTFKNLDNDNNLTITVKDLTVFPELEDRYEQFSSLSNLSLTFVFSPIPKNKISYLCRRLRLPFV